MTNSAGYTRQSYAATLGYVPLPAAIEHLAAALAQVTAPAGTPLAS